MKTIKISIDQPYIDPNSDLEHTGTSYQVSKIPSFDNSDTIVLDVDNDSEHLLEYRFEYDLQPNESLYVRNKYYFNNGIDSGWSKIIPINRYQVGIKMSNNIINTPDVKYDISYDEDSEGTITIYTNDFSMYGGLGVHQSTSWSIIDSDNNVVYDREEDSDNLLNINIPMSIIDKSKTYVINVKHHSDTNTVSNAGKAILTLNTDLNHLYELVTHFPLVPNRYMYFELRLYTTNFTSLDIIILDNNDNIVAQKLNQTVTHPYIYTGDLLVGSTYRVKAKINLSNTALTTYNEVLRASAISNELIDFANIDYLNKYTYMHEMLTNGKAVQTSIESYSNGIFITKSNDNHIYKCEMRNNQLVLQYPVIEYDTLDNVFDKTYMNIIELRNGDLLLDYAGDLEDGVYRKPFFKIYRYDHLSETFDLLNTVERTDERYSTAISMSAAPLVNNKVYYIPAMLLDSDDNSIDLVLKAYDINSNTITTISGLPVSIKRFGNIIDIGNDELLFMGGVNDIDVYNSYFTRDNNKIYKYNITANSWTEINDISGIIPDNIYNMQAVRRRDNKIVLFNSSAYGDGAKNQDTYVYDISSNTIEVINMDVADDVPYESSLVLLSGDVIRISGRAKDPQKLFRYISNTVAATDVVDDTTYDVIKDLVVNLNETITIENPYRFETITIKGNDTTDTGTLVWIDGDNRKVFHYKDLIITRDTCRSEIDEEEYDTITVLEGASIQDC